MLNNAIKGDYIAAETDPSVSLYKKEIMASASRIYLYCLIFWSVIRNSKGEGVPKGHIALYFLK